MALGWITRSLARSRRKRPALRRCSQAWEEELKSSAGDEEAWMAMVVLVFWTSQVALSSGLPLLVEVEGAGLDD